MQLPVRYTPTTAVNDPPRCGMVHETPAQGSSARLESGALVLRLTSAPIHHMVQHAHLSTPSTCFTRPSLHYAPQPSHTRAESSLAFVLRGCRAQSGMERKAEALFQTTRRAGHINDASVDFTRSCRLWAHRRVVV